jgi:hypothetical protein
MGWGILKPQLRDFDEIGERNDREIQPQRWENDLKYDYADGYQEWLRRRTLARFSFNTLQC